MYTTAPDSTYEIALLEASRWQRESMRMINRNSSGTSDGEIDMRTKHDRAREIETIVRRDYLDDDCDAADIALGVIEENPDWSDEEIARHVASLIAQQ